MEAGTDCVDVVAAAGQDAIFGGTPASLACTDVVVVDLNEEDMGLGAEPLVLPNREERMSEDAAEHFVQDTENDYTLDFVRKELAPEAAAAVGCWILQILLAARCFREATQFFHWPRTTAR